MTLEHTEKPMPGSVERHCGFYEDLPAMAHSIDTRGRLVWVSDRWLETLGYVRGEVIGRKSTDFLTADSRRYAEESVLPEFFRTGRCRDVPFQFVNKNGDIVHVLLSATSVRDSGGNIVSGCAVLVDVTERNRAEKRLRDSEEKFRVLAETSRGAIFLYQGEKIIYVNPSMVRLTGYSEQECLQMKFWDWVHPEEMKKIRVCGHARQKGKKVPSQYEFRYVTKEGETRWGIVSAGYVEFRGKPAGIATVIDITDRKRMEEELRKGEERFRSLFMSMSEGFYLSRIEYDDCGMPCDFSFLEVNPAIERLMGMKRDRMIGKRARELFPNLSQLWMDVFKKVASSGVPINCNFYSEASRKYFETFAFRPAEGQFACVVTDITERKLAEEALRKSEAKYRALFENSMDAIFLTCPDGRVKAANRAACEMFGMTEEELVTAGRAGVIDPTDERLPAAIEERARTGKIFCELTYVRKDGTKFPAETSSIILDGAHSIVMLRDITGRKKAEHAQKARVELLQICNDAKNSQDLIRKLAVFFQKIADCEAVGVRLREGNDFPYHETLGFPDRLVSAENSLCAQRAAGEAVFDDSGTPVLECLCGRILSGRQDPPLPLHMSQGSFWTGNASELLAGIAGEEPRGRMRYRCIRAGYESLALIPLQSPGETLGLFQFNDRRVGHFTAEKISLLEKLISYAAIAIARQRTDEALRESGKFSRQVVESANEGLIVMGPDLRYQLWNPYMEQLTGLSADMVLGAHPLELFPYLGESGIFEDVEKSRGGQKSGHGEFLVGFPHGGRSCWILTTHAPLRNTKGEIIGVIATVQEITARKLAEASLRNCTRRLIEMEEDLRRMLAAELHDEIGRDLTALGMNCSIISDSLPENSWKTIGPRIEDSRRLIEEVTRTVRNIMAKLRPPMIDDYGLPAALRWYADLFSNRTGVGVRILVDETCPRLTTEKETALFRIAQEALNNTAKHAAARNVTVKLEYDAGMLRLSIADDGMGFIHEPVSTFQPGSGWGLTIMRERAELFGGNFKVDSILGAGTTVTVEIREEL